MREHRSKGCGRLRRAAGTVSALALVLWPLSRGEISCQIVHTTRHPSMKRVSKKPIPAPSNPALVLDAFEVLLQHGVQTLCDYVERGDDAFARLSVDQIAVVKRDRLACAALLNTTPILCKTFRTCARGDSRYAAIMFYERTRLGAASSGHFLEGMCSGLCLFNGPTPVVLNDGDLVKLKLCDVVADRVKTVLNLESLKNGEDRLVNLVRDYSLSDLASGVPGRVHVFLARMRAICQGIRRVKPADQVKQCNNLECCRLFYSGAKIETNGVRSTPEDLFGESEVCEVSDYWTMAAGSLPPMDHQDQFCTSVCHKQWRNQLNLALPDFTDAFLVADYQCRKTGRARVSEALRLISKRNEQAGRHLRALQKEKKTFPAVSIHELGEHQRSRIRALNVDLGVVYAASLLADSKSLSGRKVLAGSAEGWRSKHALYAKQVQDVGKLYDRYHIGTNIISNFHVTEPFIQKLRSKASKLA